MRHLSLALALIVTLVLIGSACAQSVDYLREIKPLLSEKCYSCHGVLKQESDLRLETRTLMLERDVIVPGDPAASELFTRITDHGDQRMPPPDEGAALLPDQLELIRRWIRDGAPAPEETPPPAPTEHWAFQPIPSGIAIPSADASVHPVDALLDAKRSTLGLQTVGPAPRSLLIRRLYLDLIGLPPTSVQLEDNRPWEQIVDDLLASPAHGERWARHWMDVWRYSDWYGLGQQVRNSQKHIWHWRDWIIQSLNEDKGYDRMVLEMLAGDELAPNDRDAVAGTGFLARNYYLFNRTTWLDETIEHTGKAFLGLTLNCAKCHDHKYDPISQVDYYRFRAILEPHQIRLDPIAGVDDFEKDGLPRAFDDAIDRPTYLHRRGDPKNPDKETIIRPGVPAILASFAPPVEPIRLPPTAFAPGTRDDVQQAAIENARDAIKTAETELAKAKKRLAERPAERLAERSADESSLKAAASPSADAFRLHDSFDRPHPDRWQLVGDGWAYRNGALHQTKSTREGHLAKLIPKLPRNFEVDCTYTTTGGTTYKSVSFRFDQSADAKTSNYVYSSAHEAGPKVHVAFTRNGSSTYPPEGRKAAPIKVGQKFRLRFAVRETLVNVWLDDAFIIAYELPDRQEGFFSLSGFDATVAFDQITIAALAPDIELTPAGNQPIASPAEAETAVKAAELKRASAAAQLESVVATVQADKARYGAGVSEDETKRLAKVAARKQLVAAIADADYRIVIDATDANKRKAAEKQKSAAEQSLHQLDQSEPDYQSLRGSKKALESPAHQQTDYPAAYSPVSSGRRLALARWMTSRKNPLTARVAVNHVWMRHFGTPLVESVFDFGLRSKKPLHADLLDFLAADFVDSGWSFKRLHRLIVTSNAYQLATSSRGADSLARETDPNNEFYWRFNSRRMESQLVRDSLLALGGTLDPKMGGASLDPGSSTTRRSVYLKHSRDQRDKFLSMFDDADILRCYRRSESIVPQQALALSNSKLAIEMSARIADRLAGSVQPESTIGFIDVVFKELLCRLPTPAERSECRGFTHAMAELPELQSLDETERVSRIRSRLVQAVLNHNDFITVR